jgi:hypothetical protein
MVKRNAASAVRNRIPASVDVMMWTVMNMQRSVKNMRLIDADELIKYIKIWEIETSISSDQKEFIDCINKQPTAFDADKVVEQLETRKTRAAALQKENISEYFEGETDAFEFATKIVKGGGVE